MQNDLKGIMYVLIQTVLFLLYLFPVYDIKMLCFPSVRYFFLAITIIGVVIIVGAILQLRNQLSPFPAPVAHGDLIQNGIFKFSRHPIYTGILISSFFYALYSCSGYRIILSFGIIILFYFKSSYEEELLSQKFPGYITYKKRVGRFFPKFSKTK